MPKTNVPHVPTSTAQTGRVPEPSRSSRRLLVPCLLIAALVAVFSQAQDIGSATMVLLFLTCVSMVFAGSAASARNDPFSPIGFPYLYSALTVLASVAVAATVGFTATFLTEDLLTPRLALVLGVFLTGLATVPLLAKTTPHFGVDVPATAQRLPLCALAGNLFIAVAAAYRIYQVRSQGVGSWNATRGTDFSVGSQIEIVASALPLAGVALLLLANHRPRRFLFAPGTLFLLTIWSLASLAVGSRDDVVGPLVLAAWAFHHRTRRIGMAGVLALAGLGLVLLAAVGIWRVGESTFDPAGIARPIASGTNTTALTVSRVPEFSPYLHGETYLASLKYSVPFAGPDIAAGNDLSAALRFPSLISYTAPSGLGYSPIAEAYWNWGLVGTFVAPFLFGALLVWAYRRSRSWAIHPGDLFYGVLLARIPISLRSDFLQQFKGVLVVMALIMLVFLVASAFQQRSPSSARQTRYPA